MPYSRRDFLARTTWALALGAAGAGCSRDGDASGDEIDEIDALPEPEPLPRPALLRNANDWDEVRDQFALSEDVIHMSALYVASHPKAVRDAIASYRQELDRNPVTFLNRNNRRRVNAVLSSAADYLGVDEPSDIALTDSTTMGIGLVYNGLQLPAGSEILSTTRDYYATHEALRLATLRMNISVRQIPLYDDIHQATEASLTDALAGAITPRTRALALTWVHSGTGLKLPMRHIADAVARINAGRDEQDRVLICLDGVHGFGVENLTMGDLGCDFFMAGCHKWLFGPRGTGLIWGSPRGWEQVVATVPSFYDDGTRQAWLNGTSVTERTDGRRMSPGGFKPFEHQWAITEAFALHQEIGKARIAARTHELARQLKEGLRQMKHVTLQTPMATELSSGIVCFDIDRMNPFAAVRRLRRQHIIATVTPYAERHVRLAPCIRNSPAEIEVVLRAIRELRR
jgi:isopenicillin-N epimerase